MTKFLRRSLVTPETMFGCTSPISMISVIPRYFSLRLVRHVSVHLYRSDIAVTCTIRTGLQPEFFVSTTPAIVTRDLHRRMPKLRPGFVPKDNGARSAPPSLIGTFSPFQGQQDSTLGPSLQFIRFSCTRTGAKVPPHGKFCSALSLFTKPPPSSSASLPRSHLGR